MTQPNNKPPIILSPAGDTNSFLAAVAAGADAVYCGLKIFSARMEAGNFSIEELSRLTQLAHAKNVQVYIAFNSIIKETEIDKARRILEKLVRYVSADALIIQDPAMVPLARQAGFKGGLHLSTLGNCTHPAGLAAAQNMGFSRVVLPREFNLDEIKTMASSIPHGLDLEVFIHGALCYSVSGRCYWSSWLGGKSALRGRCVQPCRRLYEQNGHKRRHFSCMDLSADVLVKVIKEIPNITTWKIEGRKKSPHYVYYTTLAYKLLRDDPGQKKQALYFLDYALGRQGSHYNLLSHRVSNPLDHDPKTGSETGSGLFLGRIKNPFEPYFITREALLAQDLLRIGYEEDSFHTTVKVSRAIPKKGKFFLGGKKSRRIPKGAPVFMIDRRGQELKNQIDELAAELEMLPKVQVRPVSASSKTAGIPKEKPQTGRSRQGHKADRNKDIRFAHEMNVFRKQPDSSSGHADTGMWISAGGYGIKPGAKSWLWLDPVIFPNEENICRNYVKTAVKKGAKNFVLNSPWQIALFDNPTKMNLWAGPFCNITNTTALELLKSMGFSGAVVSPELDRQTILSLPGRSALPLGVVTTANWPMAISRIASADLNLGKGFASPMKETAWTSKFNNTYYTFPDWTLDLSQKKQELQQAGFVLFIHLVERIPKGIRMKARPGIWNWNLKLL